MIKKSILTLLFTALTLAPVTVSNAKAEGISIGLVDSNTIVAKSELYAALRKAQSELGNLEKNFQKEYMEKAGKLQQAKTKEEYDRLQKQYETELKRKQSDAMRILQQKQKALDSKKEELRKKVELAIRDIAKQKKLTYVIDKQAMFFGGTDITNDVLGRVK